MTGGCKPSSRSTQNAVTDHAHAHAHGWAPLKDLRPGPRRRPGLGTWVLALEGGHAQVLADLLLQHVILPGLVGRPLVLDQVLRGVVAEAEHRNGHALRAAAGTFRFFF